MHAVHIKYIYFSRPLFVHVGSHLQVTKKLFLNKLVRILIIITAYIVGQGERGTDGAPGNPGAKGEKVCKFACVH